jgi:predicted Rossmann fold nucleotide-binding protein DprA/Smf involved in DNA uptake
MKEMEFLMKTVSDGLKILAQGVNVIADKLETFVEQNSRGTGGSPAKSVPVHVTREKPKAGKTRQRAAARPVVKVKNAVSASDKVYEVMRRMGRPVELDLLTEKTGFDKKQIHNALYKLKKQGKVENVSKGVYRMVA